MAIGGIGRGHARAGRPRGILEHSREKRKTSGRRLRLTDQAKRRQTSEAARETRLLAIRQEAERMGRPLERGIRPEGAPFPKASPETGYYGIHLLKEPQWT